MAFSDDFMYRLTAENPINEVVASYTSVIQRGSRYVCLCPFHSEKTPSFVLYPDTQSFYCFGCGTGGSVINFIKKAENMEFVEAVELLAKRAGIPMPEDSKYNAQNERVKTRILEINRESAVFFHKSLLSDPSKSALKYLLARGLPPKLCNKYGLGFAPDGWDRLKNHLNSLGFSDGELTAAGVCTEKNGRVFDMYRNRVMFPIIDARGNVIAFGGRVLGDGLPKYINSPDTPVFKKSKNLFSLNFAKNSLPPDRKIILAEGYMDAISIHGAGFGNVVATLGTALTPEQARILSGYAKGGVVIAYDSDAAGQTAAVRAVNILGAAGISASIIDLEDCKDPDEYIKKHGADRFGFVLGNAEGAVNFILDGCREGLDLETETGRIEGVKRSVKVLADISDKLERDVYISKVARDYGVSADVLANSVNGKLAEAAGKNYSNTGLDGKREAVAARKNLSAFAQTKNAKAEEYIIVYLIRNPDAAGSLLEKLPPERFPDGFNRKIYSALTKNTVSSANFTFNLLSNEFSDEEMAKITEIGVKHEQVDISPAVIDDCIRTLESFCESADGRAYVSDESLLKFAADRRKEL